MDKEKGLFKAETSPSLFSVTRAALVTTSPHSYQERDHHYPRICSPDRQGDKKKIFLIMVFVKLGEGTNPRINIPHVERDNYRDQN